MICLIKDGAIVLGPVAASSPEVAQALYVAGFTLVGDVLTSPDGASVGHLPHEDTASSVTLAGGYAIWPVVEVQPSPGPGQIVSGWVNTAANGVVTRSPIYGQAPEPAKQTSFTRLDFMNRFTPAELAALKAKEASDPMVGVFWEQLRAAETISTLDSRTIQALEYLAMQSYISTERKTEILGG